METENGDEAAMFLVIEWMGDTHYVNGGGMSSAALVCALNNPTPLWKEMPHRREADGLEFLSDTPPTCQWCLEIEAKTQPHNDKA